MEKNRTIVTAPETDDVVNLYDLFRTMPGNKEKTRREFYYLLTSITTEREEFLLMAKQVPEISGNVIRQKYIKG